MLRRVLAAAVCLAAACLSATVSAGGEPDRLIDFHIDKKTLGEAMDALAQQADVQLLYPYRLANETGVKPVFGRYTLREALEEMFRDASFSAGLTPDGVVTISSANGLEREQTDMNIAKLNAALLAGAATFVYGAASAQDGDAIMDGAGKSESQEKRDEIVVTGTNIRGLGPQSSPMQTYTREEILESGAASTEQFMRSLPQNFGGGSTEFAPGGVPGDQSTVYNNTYATGANLRGLGSGATLTLLNGRRLAPTSEIGDFVDLSLIPISALERVDVLSDGASAIYGGDAVAGVVNFVLRRDFDGAETAVRYGTVTSGELQEARVSQALGASWGGGNILATYEYYRRGSLRLSDRPEIPAPTLSTGQPVIETELHDLMPQQERHGGIVSFNQVFTDQLSVSANGLFSSRSADSTTAHASGAVNAIYNYDTNSRIVSLSLGAEYEPSPEWTVSLDATYSRVDSREEFSSLRLDPAETGRRNTKTELWSADIVLNGDVISLPGGDVRAALGGHVRQENLVTGYISQDIDRQGSRDVWAAYGELFIPLIGENNAAPGIEQLVLNASGRLDRYSDFGTTVNPKIGVLWSPVAGLNARGSYSTSFAPPALGRTGDLQRGGVVFPMSFITAILGVEPPDPAFIGSDVLQISGTAANLEPETSRSFTFGFDHAFETERHSWSASATYYDIAFEGRLGATPMPQNLPGAFAPFLAYDDPGLFPEGTVIYYPSAAEIESLVARFVNPILFVGGATSLDNIAIINNATVIRNIAETKTRGVDIEGAYGRSTKFGDFTVGLNANYIIDFSRRAAVTTPAVDILNSYANPVDLKLRGRVGYAHSGFSGNVFVNYVDSYSTDASDTAVAIDAWTTVDLSLSYNFSDRSGWLTGATLNFAVTNLLNEAPPIAPPNGGFRLAGFDPANASPLMRFIAFEVRKTF